MGRAVGIIIIMYYVYVCANGVFIIVSVWFPVCVFVVLLCVV